MKFVIFYEGSKNANMEEDIKCLLKMYKIETGSFIFRNSLFELYFEHAYNISMLNNEINIIEKKYSHRIRLQERFEI